MEQPQLILASASPRRLDLLASIGIKPFAIHPANIDETPARNELPKAYAERMARQKAEAIARIAPDKTVLAADTVVYCGRRILPKAEDEATARICLAVLSGRRHRVGTAVAVGSSGSIKLRYAITLVRFKLLCKNEIDAYISSGEWHGKAGGYAIQGKAAAFIPFLSGSYSNVVGLPLYETCILLGLNGQI